MSTNGVVRELHTREAHDLAWKRIEDCVRTHQGCPKTQEFPLPTRVIDCEDQSHPRLVTTNGESGRYLALSYVWGEAQPHSTTALNVASYHVGIDVSHLPQTIKDAIATTSAFGFRYLWTDSLCIIQDSEDDKAREIGRMAGIYTNAFLTIVAASASKVSEGFLQPRGEVVPPDISLPFWCPEKNDIGTVHLVQLSRLRQVPPDPVSRRAWCFQEWILSSRALVFSAYTLQYHCNSGVMNIGNTLNPWTPETGKRLPLSYLTPPSAPPIFKNDVDWHHYRTPWWKVLTDYTERSVTVPGDKLVALSAVAEQCQKAYHARYLAGLWKDALFKDLLWSSASGTPPQPRPKAYRAPSWSWAAIDGPIADMSEGFTGREISENLCAEVLHCSVSLAREELRFGEVAGGLLVLRTRVVEAQLIISKNNPGEGRVYIPRREYYRLLKEGTDKRRLKTRIFEWWRPRKYIGAARMDSSDDYGIQAVHVVFIWTNSGFTGVDGLLVVPVIQTHSPEKVQYRRVGHYSQPWTHGGALDHSNYRWKNWMSGVARVEIEII